MLAYMGKINILCWKIFSLIWNFILLNIESDISYNMIFCLYYLSFPKNVMYNTKQILSVGFSVDVLKLYKSSY